MWIFRMKSSYIFSTDYMDGWYTTAAFFLDFSINFIYIQWVSFKWNDCSYQFIFHYLFMFHYFFFFSPTAFFINFTFCYSNSQDLFRINLNFIRKININPALVAVYLSANHYLLHECTHMYLTYGVAGGSSVRVKQMYAEAQFLRLNISRAYQE